MVKNGVVMALIALLMVGCATKNFQATPTVNHVVLIWLKDSANVQHRQAVMQATERLQDIPGLLDLKVGTVIPSERKIVDDSFDVGVYMRFKHQAAMQAYTAHPQHRDIVKNEVLPLAAKILIYDF